MPQRQKYCKIIFKILFLSSPQMILFHIDIDESNIK